MRRFLGNDSSRFKMKSEGYFLALKETFEEACALHAQAENWPNVLDHCLMEVARVAVLAELFFLPKDLKQDLMMAAAIHDFFKKGEKDIVTSQGLTWDSFEVASTESTRLMREAGFSDRVVRLANAVGHGSLLETESILSKEALSSDDMAYLIMHYVDDYTVGSEWASFACLKAGVVVNSLDTRMDNNDANERYAPLNEEGRQHFGGEKTFDAQRRIGVSVEERLSALLELLVDAKHLPELIDARIRIQISG